ncbi:MAG: winged helix-turn-helix domain-containing protein [Candidatus Bathyarchaeia archaeon]
MPQDEPGKPRGRNREMIFYDILRSIVRQEQKGFVRITRVQNETNLPSDRLRGHLRQMVRLRLITYSSAIRSTTKGREFLSQYKRVLVVLKRFGLAE